MIACGLVRIKLVLTTPSPSEADRFSTKVSGETPDADGDG